MAADLVWPLLVDGISTGEKVSVAVQFASSLLHELGHAAAWYVTYLVIEDVVSESELHVNPSSLDTYLAD